MRYTHHSFWVDEKQVLLGIALHAGKNVLAGGPVRLANEEVAILKKRNDKQDESFNSIAPQIWKEEVEEEKQLTNSSTYANTLDHLSAGAVRSCIVSSLSLSLSLSTLLNSE